MPSDRTIASATLTTTADNQVTAYVNGTQVSTTSDWTKAAQQDVTSVLVPGANVVALAAFNINGLGRAHQPAAHQLHQRRSLGHRHWRIHQDGRTRKSPGWQAPGLDDSTWPAALDLGTYGISPWKTGVTVAPPAMVSAPLFRKEFTAPAAITRARAYITGLGNYTLNINGKRLTTDSGSCLHGIREDCLYATYDVTADLRAGQNAIGVELAPGFYYYNTPKLLMQLVIDYADGTSTTIVSDNTWQLDNSGPTSFAASGGASGQPVFGGESYDARRYPVGWDRRASTPPDGSRPTFCPHRVGDWSPRPKTR